MRNLLLALSFIEQLYNYNFSLVAWSYIIFFNNALVIK